MVAEADHWATGRMETKLTGEEGGASDSWVLQTVLRLLDGSLSDSELGEFCSLLASNQLFRQKYLQCVQTIADLHLGTRERGRKQLKENSPRA
jgi:hypothetical protein